MLLICKLTSLSNIIYPLTKLSFYGYFYQWCKRWEKGKKMRFERKGAFVTITSLLCLCWCNKEKQIMSLFALVLPCSYKIWRIFKKKLHSYLACSQICFFFLWKIQVQIQNKIEKKNFVAWLGIERLLHYF